LNVQRFNVQRFKLKLVETLDKLMANISALSGLRALIVGLGREGSALAMYLARHGLTVTATDLQPAENLGSAPAAVAGAGVSLVLGEHPLALLDNTDLILVSPGVPLEIPFLQAARAQQIPLSTESRLFCYLCPAPIVAVTGSSGKTTTVTLVGQIMEAASRKTWVGGNIGRPLIEWVDQMTPSDVVVMELSSFQLEYFHAKLNQGAKANPALAGLLASYSPSISAILNITPNHLDRHPSMKQYVRAKRAIIDYQSPDGVVVMNLDNDMTRTIGNQFKPRVCWFSLEAVMPNGACLLKDNLALLDSAGNPHIVARQAEIKLRGRHNLSNILAACLLAREAGASVEAMRSVITTFTGVAHRLQLVRELNGVSYYNDSISTTPERVVAALYSFSEPIVLLAGGRDKHLSWEETARLILHKTRHLIVFGEAVELIAAAVKKAHLDNPASHTVVHRCADLSEAIKLSAQIAQPGQVVLLSPGCASFDAFHDYAERGDHFAEWVREL
jgi:UDP-N-acetylmuramoylalanine--D-glutamate ligase